MSDLVVVYRLDTGAAVSYGSVVPPTVPAGLAVKTFTTPTWEQFAAGGYVWDPVALQPVAMPVPLEITVSKNLRVKGRAAITQTTDPVTGSLKQITDALAAVATVKAATPTNITQMNTQLDALCDQVTVGLAATRRALNQTTAIIRLLLGDFYSETDMLQSEAGTNGA